MSTRFADFIEPWAWAQAGRSLEGEIALERLSRLAPSLLDAGGAVAVRLECRSDEKRRPRIEGWVRATLRLQCQRCLEPVEVLVDQEVDLVAVATPAEAESLPEALDPLLVVDGRVRVQDLVEDELLLALPLIPRHAWDCGPEAADGPAPNGDEVSADDAPLSPLATALAGLKRPH